MKLLGKVSQNQLFGSNLYQHFLNIETNES
jgi:hypothetical protein